MYEHSEHLYDAIYGWKDYPAEVERLDAVIREHLPEARTILDVACGTGKHLDLLRDRGYEVGGVDLDPKMLELARERLGPDVPLRVGDLVNLDLGETFDVVMCLFSSIAYGIDPDGPGVPGRDAAGRPILERGRTANLRPGRRLLPLGQGTLAVLAMASTPTSSVRPSA